jgi:wyosine [tRNA(Phe)-imidazoG37] synthetase (radical SAM superfamily)
LYLPDIRHELLDADVVLPSLDAGNPKLYRKINRPHPEITFERLVNGLISFREEYENNLWVEVMLVEGLNDSSHEVEEIAVTLESIKPDLVHINLPTRPPCETWVKPPGPEALMRAMAILGRTAEVVPPAEGTFDLSGSDNPVEALINIISRHPMRQDQVERTLEHKTAKQVNQILADLEASEKVKIVERFGERFWRAAPAHFPEVKTTG